MKNLHEHLTDLRAELEEKKLELLKLRTEISARYIGIRKIKKLIARGPVEGVPVPPVPAPVRARTFLDETPPETVEAWYEDHVAACQSTGKQPLSFAQYRANLARPTQGDV